MAHPLVVHCKRDEYDVYVGRGKGSKWGNPFSSREGTLARYRVEGGREEAIAAYRRWLWARIRSGEVKLEDLAGLAGKRLGCWCAPYHKCHAEVLVAAAEWAVRELQARDRDARP